LLATKKVTKIKDLTTQIRFEIKEAYFHVRYILKKNADIASQGAEEGKEGNDLPCSSTLGTMFKLRLEQ